ncbi:MAG TPA: hypothetical protein VE573_04135 [Nitrososphaeraceae archaeon]|jgi:hypothetical protein|nr:hypothetical protein [Nitrososphaeraceae archaeon]
MKILTRERRGRLVLDLLQSRQNMHTTGIYGNIKVVRVRNSPWIAEDDLYEKLVEK